MAVPRDLLRATGLRSTPQRRAILAVFIGGPSEHLAADEIYTRAERTMPGLGRGTVYATLAEFTEAGLIAAVGSSEAVRYEVNTSPHAHFRCRLCLRIVDVNAPALSTGPFESAGHHVERFDLRAEGICVGCRDYGAGLEAGTRVMSRLGAMPDVLAPGTGALAVETPLGPMLLAASPAGLLRCGFPDQGDAGQLRALVGRGGAAAQAHLEAGVLRLRRYFSDAADPAGDWTASDQLHPEAAATLALLDQIPSGAERSYHELGSELSPHDLGFALGANPLAVLGPCHRVTLGATEPEVFVGGLERRRWLLAHERASAL
jgi:Fe2+ or Zn2+ uptake regulation protein/O6-methylguanine-DNA--protein-cysteine methyltransferase